MISFKVDTLFILDLRDDFLMNTSKKLYDFIGLDFVKAFHLGIHVTKWFDSLDRNQQYLHSKSLRHNQEDIQQYVNQMTYWSKIFPHSLDDDQIDTIELSEYIFNNIIWTSSDIEKDQIKVALFLGMVVGKNTNIDDEQLLYSVH